MRFDLPREFFPSLNMSERTYMNLAFVLTLLASVLIFLPGFSERWDVIEYDRDQLEKNLRNITIELNDGNLTKRFEFDKNASILWDTFPCGTKTGRNGSLLLNENGGVWKLCRVADEYVHQVLLENCKEISLCMSYTERVDNHDNFGSYCCGACCPFLEQERKDMSEAGVTTHEAIYTTVSSVIVAMILQCASYCQIVLSYRYKYVTMSRMTGVTLALSGVFMSFALIVTHYRVALMDSHEKFLPYMPKEVLDVSSASVGWCVYVGWAAVAVNAIVSCIWIQLSRYQVQIRSLKRPPSPNKGKETNPTLGQPRQSLPSRFRSGRRSPMASQGPSEVKNGPMRSKVTPSINVEQL